MGINLNKISKLIFPIFKPLFKRQVELKPIQSNKGMNILIIALGNLQETMSVNPLIKFLSENLSCTINSLTKKEVANVFDNNKYIDSAITLEKTTSLFSLVHLLNKFNFDIVIDATDTAIDANKIILPLLKSKFKVGFEEFHNGFLTHNIIKPNSNKTHIVDRILTLLDAVDIEVTKSSLNFFYTPTLISQKKIMDYMIKHNILHNFLVVINISSENDIGFWGIDRFKKLIKYLNNYNVKIIIASSMEDIDYAEKIADNKHPIYYNTDFDEYAELLRKSNFVFSPDSYTVFLAGAFKIPVFCLFVQRQNYEMIRVPYNSDFDFTLTEKNKLSDISYGKVLNSFVPYFEYVYNDNKTINDN